MVSSPADAHAAALRSAVVQRFCALLMPVAMSDAGWMSAMVPGVKKTGVVRSDAVLLVSLSQIYFSVRYQAGLHQCCRGRREGGRANEGGMEGEKGRKRGRGREAGREIRNKGGREGRGGKEGGKMGNKGGKEGGREGECGMEGEKKGGTLAGFLHYNCNRVCTYTANSCSHHTSQGHPADQWGILGLQIGLPGP